MRRLLLLFLTLAVLAGGAAGAQAAQPWQATYNAYNTFDGWRPATYNKCSITNVVYGNEPADNGPHPVFIYLHGTLGDYGGNQEGRLVTKMAADRGWSAAAFTYSAVGATQTSIDGISKCMFDPSQKADPTSTKYKYGNALALVCGRPSADCSQGVVVAGMSAGGAIAMRAKNFNAAVQAVWAMGVGGCNPSFGCFPVTAAGIAAPDGTRALPNNRLRIDDGQTDLQIKDKATGKYIGWDPQGIATVNHFTGSSCSTTDPDPTCLRPDGSGYHIVRNSEVADGVADHCYWERVNKFAPTNSCTWTPTEATLDPGWISPARPWSLPTSLAWLGAQLAPAATP
jgi:hypothetical protein